MVDAAEPNTNCRPKDKAPRMMPYGVILHSREGGGLRQIGTDVGAHVMEMEKGEERSFWVDPTEYYAVG